MEEIIMNNGFIKNDSLNEYTRGDWTIRIDDELIEIFNDPDKAPGRYIIYPLYKVDINIILEEINKL